MSDWRPIETVELDGNWAVFWDKEAREPRLHKASPNDRVEWLAKRYSRWMPVHPPEGA